MREIEQRAFFLRRSHAEDFDLELSHLVQLQPCMSVSFADGPPMSTPMLKRGHQPHARKGRKEARVLRRSSGQTTKKLQG